MSSMEIEMRAMLRITRRARSKFHRLCTEYIFRRPLTIRTDVPLVSFTFDDFPATALTAGGAILRHFGCLGTYYVSLGLAGCSDIAGPMFTANDLTILFEQGHELGCHTYTHCDSGTTPSAAFVESVVANRKALAGLFPFASFRSFSYPKSAPRPNTKRLVAAQFDSCRGGGQSLNAGVADLNHLQAYFLEQAKGDIEAVRQLIAMNRAAKGWLIFATHDVCDRPSRFGCTPEFFEDVVRSAVQSGAEILPIGSALARLKKCTS